MTNVTEFTCVGNYQHRSPALNHAVAHLQAHRATVLSTPIDPNAPTIVLRQELASLIHTLSVDDGRVPHEDLVEFALRYVLQEINDQKINS